MRAMTDRIEQLRALVERFPDDAECRYSLAWELAKQGTYDEALAGYDAALAIDPAFHYAYFHKAKAQIEAGDEAGAKATLDRGIAGAGGDAKALGELRGLREELDA
jgi:tetratricopeptide (TPR) repeat protein